MSQIADIEDAMICHLKKVLGDRVRAVESGPEDWSEDYIKRMLVATPCVIVIFLGGPERNPGGAETATIKSEWSVVAVTGHEGDEKKRRTGDARAMGAYDLIEVIVPALHNLNGLKFTEVRNLFSDRGHRQSLAAYGAYFTRDIGLPNEVDLSTLDDFITFTGPVELVEPEGEPAIPVHVDLPQ